MSGLSLEEEAGAIDEGEPTGPVDETVPGGEATADETVEEEYNDGEI